MQNKPYFFKTNFWGGKRRVGAKAYKNANIAGINTNLAGFCTKYNFSRHKMYFAMHCAYD